jgi:hypothetical protein
MLFQFAKRNGGIAGLFQCLEPGKLNIWKRKKEKKKKDPQNLMAKHQERLFH